MKTHLIVDELVAEEIWEEEKHLVLRAVDLGRCDITLHSTDCLYLS
jgi:hypothetical protein